MLARSSLATVQLRSITVHADGWLLDAAGTVQMPAEVHREDALRQWRARAWETLRPKQAGLLPDGLLRIAVQFDDGRKATSLDRVLAPATRPAEPVLCEISGAGYRATDHGMAIDHRLWLWPPAEEAFDIVVEWPAFGIDLTRARWVPDDPT